MALLIAVIIDYFKNISILVSILVLILAFFRYESSIGSGSRSIAFVSITILLDTVWLFFLIFFSLHGGHLNLIVLFSLVDFILGLQGSNFLVSLVVPKIEIHL